MSEEIKSHFKVLRGGSGPDMFLVQIENYTTLEGVITHFPLCDVQVAVAVPPMNVQILARKILDLTSCGLELSEKATESDTPYILLDTIEKIVDLCGEQLTAEEGKTVE